MKTYWALVWLVLAGTACRGEWSPSAAALSDARRAAIQDAIRFAEPKEVVQNAFAELAIAPAGAGQQDLLKSKLRSDNLSMFCMTGPLNPENAAANFEYEVPGLEQIAMAAMQTAELGAVVCLNDVADVSWAETAPDQAHGSFRYATKSGYRGTCLFRARQEGSIWIITRLAIQKKGSELIEDGYPVFARAETTH